MTERQQVLSDLAELVKAVNIIAEQVMNIARALDAELVAIEDEDYD